MELHRRHLAFVLLCLTSLTLASSFSLRGARTKHIGPGCSVVVEDYSACCYRCNGCKKYGSVQRCTGKRLVNTQKRDETKLTGDSHRNSRDEGLVMGEWDDEQYVGDYWGYDEPWARRGLRDGSVLNHKDLEAEKRLYGGNPCRVIVYEGVHSCCIRKNGCKCPENVVATCI